MKVIRRCLSWRTIMAPTTRQRWATEAVGSSAEHTNAAGLLLFSRGMLFPSLNRESPARVDASDKQEVLGAGDAETEEEELLRSLVQDAFHPPASPALTKEGAKQPPLHLSHRKSNALPTPPVETMHPARVSASAAESETVRVRAANAAYEPFARVRRKSYTYTVNESKGLVSHEETMEWMCTQCQTFNFMKRTTCRHCGSFATDSYKEKHPPVRHVVLFPPTWLCTKCGAANGKLATATSTTGLAAAQQRTATATAAAVAREKFLCRECKHPFRGASDWWCPACHHMNPKAAAQCASCFHDRPISWTCNACGCKENSIFSLTCIRCGATPSPITESDAVVRCANCNARNDVRWELCEACMAPLPALTAVLTSEPHDSRAAANARATPPPTPAAARNDDSVQESRPSLVHGSGTAAAVPVPSPPRQGPRCDDETGDVGLEEHRRAHESRGLRPVVGGELLGSWWCFHCNVIQRRNAPFCDICLRPRLLAQQKAEGGNGSCATVAHVGPEQSTVSEEGPAARPAPPTAILPGMWQCPYCRQYNPVTQAQCCGKDREMPAGYWLCPKCHSTNRDERKVCLGCGAPPNAGPWSCPACQTANPSDTFECVTCASPHPALWQCRACKTVAHSSHASCPSCETARPPSSRQKTCPVCYAPNAPSRKACFRCRGRLQEDGWRCGKCDSVVADRQLWRCPTCQAPREFDTREETWVCEVCESPIASGGALPVRTQCPRCGSERNKERCLAFPSRWRCRHCRRFNWSGSPECLECGERRCIPTLRATVHCSHCFQSTLLESSETCSHCHGSLSGLLTETGSVVKCSGRGIFEALGGAVETVGLPFIAATSPPAPPPTRVIEQPSPPWKGGSEEPAAVAATVGPFSDDALAADVDDESIDSLDELDGEDGFASLLERHAVNNSVGFLDEDSLLPSTWTCPRCESANTDEYLACVKCGNPRS